MDRRKLHYQIFSVSCFNLVLEALLGG